MKRIYDSVYGYIYLEEDEFALVTSPLFQRLQRIKQMGPLHLIFPSAQHSRFSHCLGVFHIVTKMIEHFKKKAEEEGPQNAFALDEAKELRLAALLHDIGHVPLSHTGEEVLEKTYTSRIDKGSIDPFEQRVDWKKLFEGYQGRRSKLHECLSAQMVLHNEEVDRCLNKVYPERNSRDGGKKRIAKIIVGIPEQPRLGAVLHSELDADRLDFLLRDSAFAGVGYGHIELDYIISRLGIVTDEDGTERLCVHVKGLHTLEHYLLSRFFLQTQIIYNRKVRLLDILFGRVMEYLISEAQEGGGIMDLEEVLDCIRGNQSDSEEEKRAKLHRIYEYTDDLVFVKMRQLHDKLDPIVRGWKRERKKLTLLESRQAYINDCIKLTMDAQIDEPEEDHQRMVKVEGDETESYRSKMEAEAQNIAEATADELEICKERIIVDVRAEPIMKYSKLTDEEEEPNKEAVRIYYSDSDNQVRQKFAVESNASILDGLVDKRLLMMRVYYIKCRDDDDDNRRKEIKKGFRPLIQRHFQSESDVSIGVQR